jgi:hypothetical protein
MTTVVLQIAVLQLQGFCILDVSLDQGKYSAPINFGTYRYREMEFINA